LSREVQGVIMNKNKRDRFIRIAEARTNKIIKMIKLLSNCSNQNSYEYTLEEVRKVFGAIEKELRIARAKFSEDDEGKFSLK
jgi:hypothetical protein